MRRLIGAALVVGVLAGSATAEPPKEVDHETRAESLEKDALALVIMGGVMIGASAFFAYDARQKSRLLDVHPVGEPWPSDIQLIEEQGQRLSDLSLVTGVLGVGFVTTSVICYWRSRVAARDERVSIAPTATPSSVGIALSGGF